MRMRNTVNKTRKVGIRIHMLLKYISLKLAYPYNICQVVKLSRLNRPFVLEQLLKWKHVKSKGKNYDFYSVRRGSISHRL